MSKGIDRGARLVMCTRLNGEIYTWTLCCIIQEWDGGMVVDTCL